MSLDFSLIENDEEVFEANITHNLTDMAEEAGIYGYLWHPERHDVQYARDLIRPIEAGLIMMALDPARFKQLNSPNRWGLYENFLPWVADLLQACKNYPEAKVHTWV